MSNALEIHSVEGEEPVWRIRHSVLRRVSVVACVLLLTPQAALAGGPLNVDPATRTPFTWQPAAFFNVENGRLNANIDNATALTSVVNSFLAWEAIPTATLTYTDGGPLVDPGTGLPIDVDETNIFSVFPPLPDGQSPIVFDDDGILFALLGLPPGVLGFASPEFITVGAPFVILEGFAFLNGSAFGPDLDFAEAVMVHEFGHFSNLAHSVVNGQSIFFGDDTSPSPFDPLGFGPAPPDSIETMYPFLDPAIARFQKTPHADDIAALSTIYPARKAAASGHPVCNPPSSMRR